MSNEIIKVDNSLNLDWADVNGATKYHCRISKYYDFSVITHEDTNLASSAYAPTLTGGNSKYYWQWRSYIGGVWQKWNEIQSFERVTGGNDLTVSDSKWLMFEIDERGAYTLQFENAPQYSFVESQLFRTKERNLSGDLLSEYYATKGKIHLEWGENNTISVTEKNQIMRYYNMITDDIYLACALYNGTEYYRKLWKIWFEEEPTESPLDGNEERFIMTLDLEEK